MGALSTLNNQSVLAFEPGIASRVGGHVYEDTAGTVRSNAGDNQQAVCYGISAYESNAMKSSNPYSGIYEAETTRTLDNNGGNPACNQGGMIVVQGADMYNGTLTGEVAATLNATSGDSPTHSGPSVICLEGNGSRESHRGNGFVESEVMYTLNTIEKHAVCIENHPADSRVQIKDDGVVQTLSGRMGTGGGNVPMVMESMAVESHAQDSRYNVGSVNQPLSANMEHDPANGGLVMTPQVFSEVAACRNAQDGRGGFYSQMMDNPEGNVVMEAVCVGNGQVAQLKEQEKVGTLNCMHEQQAVLVVDKHMDSDYTKVLKTLEASSYKEPQMISYNSVVRRLTPLECERLQGFPDNWTDIGEWVDTTGKKRKPADAPRYKALGNSIALPFWKWLAERIAGYYQDNTKTTLITMASLFDGISGFPLSFSSAGILPVWSSEIEEFPIAVAKRHFPG